MIINRSKSNLQKSIWKEKILSNPDAIVLDIRSKSKNNKTIVRKTQSLDPTNMQDLIKKVDTMDRKRMYFLYCEDGEMSNQISNVMTALGFEKIHSLIGGIKNYGKGLVQI